jgi:hypothetical protein
MKKKAGFDFSHSFNDLMASLAAVFLILMAGMIIQKKNSEAARESDLNAASKKIVEVIKNHLKLSHKIQEDGEVYESNCVRLDASDKRLIRILFYTDRGSCPFRFGVSDYSLSPEMRKLISEELKPLFIDLATIDRDPSNPTKKDRVKYISIVGHSDATPQLNDVKRAFDGCSGPTPGENSLSDGFCNNFSLSARRAERVFFALRLAIINGQPIDPNREWMDTKFNISGRGPTHPFNSTKEDLRVWAGEFSPISVPRNTKDTNDQTKSDRRVEIEISLNS